MIIGIERGTQIGHIARAALESIAFQVADVLDAMSHDTKQPFRELRVDGGAASNDVLMQFQADLLQLPVRRPPFWRRRRRGGLSGWPVGRLLERHRGNCQTARQRHCFQPKASKEEMARATQDGETRLNAPADGTAQTKMEQQA